jgi:hypothetical protein
MADSFQREAIAQQIRQVCQTIPDSVRLIAVTKQVPVEVMKIAYDLGIRDFGESRIQETAIKQGQLQDLTDITWHMIGHLQTNKASKAIEQFQWIHSVDSLKLAQRLDQLAAAASAKPNVCLQVKIVPDPDKFGWTVSELWHDLFMLNQLKQLDIVGLMTIPPYGLESEEILNIFTLTRKFADRINLQPELNFKVQHLSMGMSDDYLLAIQSGATMVRLGRILFGERSS